VDASRALRTSKSTQEQHSKRHRPKKKKKKKNNNKKVKTHNEEDPIVRQGASDATASAARYQDIKLANDCLDSIDLQM